MHFISRTHAPKHTRAPLHSLRASTLVRVNYQSGPAYYTGNYYCSTLSKVKVSLPTRILDGEHGHNNHLLVVNYPDGKLYWDLVIKCSLTLRYYFVLAEGWANSLWGAEKVNTSKSLRTRGELGKLMQLTQ
jgi:hypothetical protein